MLKNWGMQSAQNTSNSNQCNFCGSPFPASVQNACLEDSLSHYSLQYHCLMFSLKECAKQSLVRMSQENVSQTNRSHQKMFSL